MTCKRFHEDSTPERYLRGELADGDRDEFELHYFSCDACHSELEAMRLTGSELAQLAPLPWSPPKEVSGKRNWIWWWAVPAAACAVLIVTVAITRNPDPPPVETARQATPDAVAPSVLPQDSKLLALAKFEAPAYRETILRNAAPESAAFADAMRVYRAGDYRAAAARLDPLRSKDPRSPRIVFYAAACSMLNGDPAGAERGATQAVNLGETPYLEESYWLRAKAWFALGNAASGQDDLRRLIALKGDWESKARELLGQSLGAH